MSILVGTPDGHTAEFPDGTDPAIIQSAMAKQFGAPQKADPTASNAPGMSPTSGNSFMDNLTAGVGQGMSDAALGAAQFVNKNPISQIAEQLTGNDVNGALEKLAKEKAGTDKALLDTGGGQTGSLLGQVALTAPLPVGELGAAGSLLNAAGKGAQYGAIGGALQPAQSDAEKLKQLASGIGGGAVMGGAGNAVGKVLDNLNPVAGAFNAAAGKEAASPFAAEGERLASETGVPLTPAQITGSKKQAKLENFTRQSLFGADAAHAVDDNAAQKWVGYIQKTIDGIGSSGDTGDVGQRIQGVIKNATTDLTQKRDTQAAKDFGAVRALTQGSATIEPTNTAGLLQQIVDDHAGVGSPSSNALASFAKQQLSNVAPKAVAPELSDSAKTVLTMIQRASPDSQKAMLANLDTQAPDIASQVRGALTGATESNANTAPAQGNLDKLMKLRQYVSQVAGGQSKISGDPIDRRIGAQLLGSIDADIDQAGDKIGGDVGGALKTANANYRAGSQQIEGIQQSALGKLLGDDFVSQFAHNDPAGTHTFNSIPGEAVAARLQNLAPSQISMAKGILKQYSPDTWQDVKATVLQQALDKAQMSAPSAGAKTLPANTGAYVNALVGRKPDQMAKLQAIFDPGEMDDINRTISVSKRLADRTGANPSGTTPMAEIGALLHALPRVFVGDPTAMGQIAAQVAAPKAMANVMANPEGRALVRQISLLPPGSPGLAKLSTQLAAIAGAQSMDSPAPGN